jgi:predicted adenylyl cyclase CyaB
MPREMELKSVVDDVDARRRRIEAAGARLVFEGRLDDRRYDTPDRRLSAVDEVLRLRTAYDGNGARAVLDWKGPTRHERGYKVRDELSTNVSDGDAMAAMLERMGYTVSGEIDRHVAQYALDDATIRFERYPQMDPLVEVEGTPDAIERAITALGMDRAGFTADRLPAFVARFEDRTGGPGAVNRRQIDDNAREAHGG